MFYEIITIIHILIIYTLIASLWISHCRLEAKSKPITTIDISTFYQNVVLEELKALFLSEDESAESAESEEEVHNDDIKEEEIEYEIIKKEN